MRGQFCIAPYSKETIIKVLFISHMVAGLFFPPKVHFGFTVMSEPFVIKNASLLH